MVPARGRRKSFPSTLKPVFSNEDYLAELLTEAGLVTADEVARARNTMHGAETLIENLLAHTTLTQEGVAQTLAVNAGIPFARLPISSAAS